LVLLGAWRVYPVFTVIAASAVVLTAGYMLWALQRIYLGPPNEKYKDLAEINTRELVTLAPLAVIVLVLGIYPLLILDLQSPALVALAEKVVAAAPSATHLAAVGAGH
jgi:NADH-quinone oxidoreductase subunit M